jgi:carboxyl-terminal processing protease
LKISSSRIALVAAALCAPLMALMSHAQAPVKVVEYYNTTVAGYFLTGRASEQALLDAQLGFKRTGMSFDAVASTGAAAPLDSICRYAAAIDPAKFVSHFYGVTADCNLIESAKPANFFAEGFDFAVQKPNAGVCPASAPIAVYRSLRGISPVDVPVHRYTVSRASYDTMTRRGWSAEGPVFCVTAATDETPRPTFANSATLKNKCQSPRTGINPISGQPYPDTAGTIELEKSFLRSFTDETYLWYREVNPADAATFAAPTDYFGALKTLAKSNSLKPNGAVRDKDEFHFFEDTASAESGDSGVELSYGIEWSVVSNSPPRNWIAALVSPGSPAELAGVKRGDRLITIDGVDFVSGNNLSRINTALFPRQAGRVVPFVFRPADGTPNLNVSLTALELPIKSVPSTAVINTPTGKVGYLPFTTFNTFTAEDDLVSAFAGLRDAQVNDLVVDLRYNGGGFIYISAQLSYMVAGAARTNNKTFSVLKANDKTDSEAFPFLDVTVGNGKLAPNQPLPSLNLGRVYVLTSPGTCSASESFINGLRGIDVEVILIGDTTCGKPYGFSREDNCGTSYYSIQFTSLNNKAQGDYITGFGATCSAGDDLSKPLGSPDEKQLAAALAYRSTRRCNTANAAMQKTQSKLANESDVLAIIDPRQRKKSLMLTAPAGTVARGSERIQAMRPTELTSQ